MAGIPGLRKVQIGAEGTAGSAVAASTIWRGPGALIGDRAKVVALREDVGYIGGTDRSVVAGKLAWLGLPAAPATFEQVLHVLRAGVVEDAAPTGGGAAKTWSYPLATTSSPSTKTLTLEAGDNQQAYEMEYSHVREFRLRGAQDGMLYLASTWQGRQKSSCSFTGSLSVPSVEAIPFTLASFYIDAIGGSLGGTEKSGTLLGCTLAVQTGLRPYWTGDGALLFTALEYGVPRVTLTATLLYDATAVAAEADHIAQTARLVRLEWLGSLITGSTYKTLRVDLAGKWRSFDVVGAQGGRDVVRGRFVAGWDTTASKFAEFTVINELAAIP